MLEACWKQYLCSLTPSIYKKMQGVYQEIVKILSEGGSAALATIVSTRGSTPRREGAKMLINADGSVIGSIGGGGVELKVCQEAAQVMKEGKPKLLHFELTEKQVEAGMICGGDMEVFIEPILSQPTLYLFGAGHISIPLAQMGKFLGFRVVVIDDRAEYANPQRFPQADIVLAEDFEKVFRELKIDKSGYMVIATRGHSFDEIVLQWALGTGAKYIGMMGSRNKIEAIFSHLSSKGISEEALTRVNTPIGLEIGAETPEEIAISILAQIIKIRRLQSGSE